MTAADIDARSKQAVKAGGDEPIVVFDGVRLVFGGSAGDVLALDGVSFDVPAHQITTVVGPSGCGKTTLLRLVSGLVKSSAGRVLFKGRAIEGLNTEIGFVTQDSNLFPWLTAVENVEFPLVLRGVPKAERRDRARRWLDLVGLTGFEAAYPGELSGGMQKRVAMARTLIYEPEVVLMDEPFGALDAQTRMSLHHELLALWAKQSTTIVFITHDLVEAITISDRIVVLSGRPAKVSAIHTVPLTRPRNVYQIFLEPGFDEAYAALWRHFQPDVAAPQPGGRR